MTSFGKIVIGGLAIILASGLYYWVNSFMTNEQAALSSEVQTKTEENTLVSSTTAATTTLTSTTTKKMAQNTITFTEFMKKGGSYKCTVTQTVASMTSNGTVYIHDSLIKGNFSTRIQGQTIDASMIARDGYVYSWTTLSAGKGFKVKMTDTSRGALPTSTSTYSWNGEQIGEYDCQPWVADDSLFELPASVTFSLVQ